MSTTEQQASTPQTDDSIFNPYDFVPMLAVACMLVGYLLYRGAHPHGLRYLWGKEILMPLGNFILFVYLLLSKVIPMLKEHLVVRHQEIVEGLQDFAHSSSNIAARFADVKEKLANVEKETAEIIERAKNRAESEKEAAKKSAEVQAERVRNSAETLTQYERHRIQKELQTRLINRAFARANELLVTHINEDDQKRLQDDYLKQLEKIS